MYFKGIVFIVFFLPGIYSYAQHPMQLGLPEGHTERITAATYSPDGKYVVTAGDDKTMRMWQTQNGRLLRSFLYTSELPVFHPSGKSMLLHEKDSTWLVDVASGSILERIQADMPFEFMADGKRIVGFDYSDGPLIYDLHFKILDSSLRKKRYWFYDFSKSPEEIYITTLDSAERLDIYDARTLAFKKSLRGHDGTIEELELTTDGRYLATAAKDSSTRIWDRKDGHCLLTIRELKEIEAIRFKPGADVLLVTLKDSLVKLYAIPSGKLLAEADTEDSYQEKAFFSPDGQFVFTSGDSVTIRSSFNLKALHQFSSTTTVAFSPDSKTLVSFGYDDRTAVIRDAASGQLIYRLRNKLTTVKLSHYGKSGKAIISACDDNNVLSLWEPGSGKLLNRLEGHKDLARLEAFSPDGRFILSSSNDHTLGIWDANSSTLLHKLFDTAYYTEIPKTMWKMGFSPDGKYVFLESHNDYKQNKLDVFETITGRHVYTIYPKGEAESRRYYSIKYNFSPGGNSFVTYCTDDTLRTYETNTGHAIAKYAIPIKNGWTTTEYSSDGTHLLVAQDSLALMLNLATGKVSRKIQGRYDGFNTAEIVEGGKYLLEKSGDTIRICDPVSWQTIATIKGETREPPRFSTDGKYVATIGDEDVISVYEMRGGQLLYKLHHPRRNNTFAIPFEFTPNSKYLVSNFYTGSWVWNLETGQKEASVYAMDKDYVVMLPNGYYQSTPGASRSLYFVKDDETIGIGQMDIRYNRPDMVMKSFSKITDATDSILINAFYNAWEKRLNKLGVKKSSFTNTSIPQAVIINRNDFGSELKHNIAKLHIHASDSSRLVQLNAWINEVPLLGNNGLQLRERNLQRFDTIITIKLSQGNNNIETSVINESGTESYRSPLLLKFNPGVYKKSVLYYVGIGIDRYKDSSMNLHYAVKDVSDLAVEFKERNPGCKVILLTNKDATRTNVLALKSRLQQAGEDDKVILSFSGHGVLDDSLNFYCSTYDINFKKPSIGGILYSDLTGLLEGIPARKKLLLIDACNSGEIDKEEVVKAVEKNPPVPTQAGAGEGKLISFGKARGNIVLSKKTGGLQNSFELMKEMFANVSRSNGIVVISAAGGREFAFEGKEFRNGVFTYSIKKGLMEGLADRNGDYNVSVNELKEYVSRQVEQLTAGKQKPTSRTEVLSNDWMLMDDHAGFASSPLADSFSNLANMANAAKKHRLCIQYLQSAIKTLRQEQNYFNNDYTYLCRNLAISYTNIADTPGMMRAYQEELDIRKKISRYSKDCADAVAALAALYKLTGKLPAAEELYKETVEIERQVSGDKSQAYAYAQNQMGIFYDEQDDYFNAVAAYEAAVKVLTLTNQFDRSVSWRMKYHDYIAILNNLAWLYRRNGKLTEAEPLYERIRGETKTADEEESVEYALALNQLAIVKDLLKKSVEADSLYRASIAILTTIKQTKTETYITVNGNLRNLYKKTGNPGAALEFALTAANGAMELYGQKSPQFAKQVNQLAIIYQQLREYKDAEDYYRLALTIYREIKGNDDADALNVENNLQLLMEERQKK